MIYSYTKCESVIAKIMADLDISEKNIRITDIREWIFEAVDKIGAPMQYIQKESGVDGVPVLKIVDRQVPMPHGIQSLDAVAYSTDKNGPWIPMRTSTSVFKKSQYDDPHIHRLMPKEIHSNYDLLVEHQRKFSLDRDIRDTDPTYFIKPGWIVTNKSKGYIKLAYKSIATDERGYPLIPDLTSYQEAIYWYVVMKLSFPKYLKGQLGGRGVNNAQNAYFYMQQQWNFYRNQAYAEAMMPTADDMKNIKNDWNKLIPEYDSDDTFFVTQGKQQLCFNDYYYGY